MTYFSQLMMIALSAITFLMGCPRLEAAEFNHTTNLIDESGPAPAAPPQEEPQFATVIDDLPLMPGLELQKDDDLIFSNSKDGRIAQTEADGPVDIDDVYKFYRRTLPHLGWKALDARSFSRENEILRIDIRADNKMTRVKFSIHPQDK